MKNNVMTNNKENDLKIKLTRQSLRPILVLVQTGKRVWNHRLRRERSVERFHRITQII